MKCQNRKLEWKYRRLRTAESETAWCQQFDAQHRLSQSKFTAFWLDTVSECRRYSRFLWRTVNLLLSPPLQCTSEKLTADQFAESFRTNVDSLWTATASADPPVIVSRQVPPLSCFKPATVPEILCLLRKTPAKSCELDPTPTWLLKQLALYIAPYICHLCNLSLKSGIFPASLKHAGV